MLPSNWIADSATPPSHPNSDSSHAGVPECCHEIRLTMARAYVRVSPIISPNTRPLHACCRSALFRGERCRYLGVDSPSFPFAFQALLHSGHRSPNRVASLHHHSNISTWEMKPTKTPRPRWKHQVAERGTILELPQWARMSHPRLLLTMQPIRRNKRALASTVACTPIRAQPSARTLPWREEAPAPLRTASKLPPPT